jgi:hypothetical protein
MKKYLTAYLLLLTAILPDCGREMDCRQVIDKMTKELDAGNLSTVKTLADKVLRSCGKDRISSGKADSLLQIADRLSIDFSVSEDQVDAKLKKSLGPFSKEEKSIWEAKGWLEYRLIDGKKMYFKRAASNLLLLRKFHEEKDQWLKEQREDPEMKFRLKHTEAVYKSSQNSGTPVEPVRLEITYTIKVNPDAVPDDETLRCWMPWPKSNHPRQNNIELLSSSNMEYMISPDTAIHSTLYMEAKAKKGVPTIFSITYRYQSGAQYFNISGLRLLPYDKHSDIYKKYTVEQLPQIAFSDKIKHLTDSIAGPDDSPSVIVRKIYYWFQNNIPWTGALEYSIMPDIPEYVLQNKRGDCGMKNFLFISMLRYKGIPARWQSGFMVPPDHENMHDWCEIYWEGRGWIPVDVDYGFQQTEIAALREFYLSGIDSYRLIINDGISGNLYPHKHFMRSEPYDFQRGEVEWKGGNLYFDKWDYDIKIEYLK